MLRIDFRQSCQNLALDGWFQLPVTKFVGEEIEGFFIAPFTPGGDGMRALFKISENGGGAEVLFRPREN